VGRALHPRSELRETLKIKENLITKTKRKEKKKEEEEEGEKKRRKKD
jgi:hypothetical protein